MSRAAETISSMWAARHLSWQGMRLAGGFEQVLASVVSMVGQIILSRMMSIDDFGILATAIGVWLLIEMFQTSVAVTPFVVSCPHPAREPEEFGAWIGWNAFLSLLVLGALVAAGALFQPFLPEFARGLILSAPITFAGMLYMFARRTHCHRQSRRALVAQTVLYGAVYGIGLIAMASTTMSPEEGTLILSLAYGVPGIVFMIFVSRSARFDKLAFRLIFRARVLIAEVATAGTIWNLSYSVTFIILAAFSTPAAVAIFSVTRTLVRPITVVLSMLLDADFSSASRSYVSNGAAALDSAIRALWKWSALLTSVPVAALLIAPEFFLHLVYGEQYVNATLELRLRVLLFVPIIWLGSLDLGLTILRDMRFLIYSHLFSLIAGFVVLAVAYMFGHLDAATALISLIVARVVSIPLLHSRYQRLRSAPVEPVVEGASGRAA